VSRGLVGLITDLKISSTSPWCALEQVVGLLIQAGGNVTACGNNQHTPLHVASMEGFPEVVRALLEAGSDPNAQTVDGYTPLELAKEGKKRDWQVVAGLLETRLAV